MTDMEETTNKSWFERLAQALIREPQDREQLIDLLHQAVEKKIIDQDALGMIEGVLQVSAMQVRDIMVPRAQMVVIPEDAVPKEFLPIITESKHSRFPVIGEDRDEIVGILLAKDLLRFDLSSTEKINLETLLRPPVFVPESKRLNILLREFRVKRNHMALVVDEYGGIAGLVTIEDVLEQIVGEIADEYDVSEEETIKKISATQYNVEALTSIADFNKYFNSHFNEEEFDTIGGLVLKNFGHMPKRSESVTIKKIHFKILHADHRRIHLLRVSLPKTKK